MKTFDLVCKAIEHNIPMLITGDTGSGKSSIVKAAASSLGYDLYDLRLAGILPEDIGGLPRPNGSYYEYLMPKWFADRLDKPFVLFLDEINQASVQVLHALYGVVLDRMVAGVKNHEMRVVAACNDFRENEYVTDLMKPLRERFPIDITHNVDWSDVDTYMKGKYPNLVTEYDIIRKSGIKLSPRNIDFGLQLLSVDVLDMTVLSKCFGDVTDTVLKHCYIKRNGNNEDTRNAQIRDAVSKIKTGSVMFGGVSIPIDKQAVIDGLDDESKETVGLLLGE